MRDFVKSIARKPSSGFNDWYEIESSMDGIEVEIVYEDHFVKLPKKLNQSAERLKPHVPDEDETLSSSTFNGDRYCLTGYEKNLRGFEEINKCKLYFKKSNYRNFLVTNGINSHWASLSGLENEWGNSISSWYEKWEKQDEISPFFYNSFGINILITIKDENHEKYALFRERSSNLAVGTGLIVGSIDEGLRRKSGDKIFDQKSYNDPTPDLMKAVIRSCEEECGIGKDIIKNGNLKLLSIGIVKSIRQPAALFHLDLDISFEEFEHACHISSDSRFEFKNTHKVRFSRDSIIQFILENETTRPVASWVVAMALYSLGGAGVRKKKLFLSHNLNDKSFARRLGKRLSEGGFDFWIDEAEIKLGESLLIKIGDAIADGVDGVIAILSKDSVRSEWVIKELDIAMNKEIHGKKLFVIPIKIDDCIMPNFLNGKLYLDLSKKFSRKRAYKKLIRDLAELK